MPAGIETYEQNSMVLQLTSDTHYFRFESKGAFWVGGVPNSEYNYVQHNLDIYFGGDWNNAPTLAIRAGGPVSYYVRNTDNGVVRYTLFCAPNQTVEWYLFSTRGPDWGNYGMQLFNEQNQLVFDTSTPVMRPLGNEFGVSYPGKVVAFVLSNYYTQYEYTFDSWDDGDRLWNKMEFWLRNIEAAYVTGDSISFGGLQWYRQTDSGYIYQQWQGAGGNMIESGSTQVMVVDVTGL